MRAQRPYSVLLAALILVWSSACICSADVFWTPGGSLVCNTSDAQDNPMIAPDGAGGAVIVWANRIVGVGYDIRAQHMDAGGGSLWPVEGVDICTAAYDQYFPVICSDGSGGYFIAWQDLRSVTADSDVYMQHISASGQSLWADDGIPVCTIPGDQYGVSLAPDGSGGVYVAWRDTRNDLDGASTDIYLQRVNSSGQRVWTEDVVTAASFLQDDRDVTALSDGAGGVILIWQDGRGVTTVPATGRDIYAQRVRPDGTLAWGASGLPVCNAAGDQRYPEVTSDGAGGVFVVWDDKRGVDYDIYAQHINSAGVCQWTTNGAPVCTYTGNQVVPTGCPDGMGGLYVGWTDARLGTALSTYNIHAQRLTSSGALAWTSSGIAVCSAVGWQGRAECASDGAGGTLLTWLDNRVDPTNTTYNYDIYAQKLNAAGSAEWAANGMVVCATSGKQEQQVVATSASGNAVVVWQDNRTDINKDIYAQKIGSILPVTGTSQAKLRCDGSWVSVAAQIVTAVLGDCYYIEDSDRISGLRVDGAGVLESQAVTVQGELATVNGERVLRNATVLEIAPSTVPKPLLMLNRDLGGSSDSAYVPGITNGVGVNNLGLLVATTGKVQSDGTGAVYIDDGSIPDDGTGSRVTVKLDTSCLDAIPTGYVIITGISSCEVDATGNIRRVLRPRRDSDIRP